MKNLRIEIVKTWYGNRYAVVGDFTHYPLARDSKGKIVTEKKVQGKKIREVNVTTSTVSRRVAEYSVGSTEKDIRTAVFSLDSNGLAKAKEVLEVLKKAK